MTPRNDARRKNEHTERTDTSDRTAAARPRPSKTSSATSRPARGAKLAGSTRRPPAPVPQPQRISAFRRWYGTLHPSLQLIGLQLWMPMFFILGFCLCYVFAFHSPHPHNVPVGIIGSDPTFIAAIQKSLPGQYIFHAYSSVTAARHDVLSGTIAVAYDPSKNEIFKASAHQFQVASLVPATFSAVITAMGGTAPKLVELAALPTWDEYGTVAMYVMLAWCICGYMVAMFIGLLGGPLRHRDRIAVIVIGGLFISLISNAVAGPIVGAIHGHYIELVLLAWGWIIAIGLAVNGLSYFAGRFIAAPAMILFVFLSMPASGGAYPKWFMPEPFAWLNNIVVGSSMVDMIKHLVYGVGPGYSRGFITMGCYAAAGVILMIVGKRWWEYRRVRAIVSGRTTMFMDAQGANRTFLMRQREEDLARHGLTTTETGSVTQVRSEAYEEELADEGVAIDMFTGSISGLQNEPATGTIPTQTIKTQGVRTSTPPARHGRHMAPSPRNTHSGDDHSDR